MNVLLIGESSYSDRIIEYFEQKTFACFSIPNVFSLYRFSGEAGNFSAFTKYTEIKADFVILTEQPRPAPVEIADVQMKSLYDDNKNSVVSGTAALEPVVFLLDYVCESPMASTIRALKDATLLARNKRKVFYLASFIRTAGRGIEVLYKEAREAGVMFIKYDDIRFSADLLDEVFTLSVSDGDFETEIITKDVYADGGLDVGESFAYVVEKLRLTTNTYGFVTEDKYYLSPVLTSRRGVYHITRDLAEERLYEGLDFIYALEKGRIWEPPSHGTAVIDANKCVFCYTCYRACPHAAMEPDPELNQMRCLTAACAGCGTCAGICPACAILPEKMPKMITIGAGNGSKPDNGATDASGGFENALVLCCENSGAAALGGSDAESSSILAGIDSNGFKLMVMPCGGVIGFERLSDLLGAFDKIFVVVCPDEACRHFSGNKRACAQVKRLNDLMAAAGMAPDNVRFAQVSPGMPAILTEELREFLGGCK